MANRPIDGPAGSRGWHEVAAALLALRGVLWVGPGGSTRIELDRRSMYREAGRDLHDAVLRLRHAGVFESAYVHAPVRVTDVGLWALRRRVAGHGPVQETLAEAAQRARRPVRL